MLENGSCLDEDATKIIMEENKKFGNGAKTQYIG